MMTIFNAVLNQVFNALLFPFEGISPWVGLTVISALTSILILLVFRKVSDQDALRVAKRKVQAGFFEMRLYQDNIRGLFSAQGAILRHNLTYLRHTAKPIAWLVFPLMLIFVQLNFRYGLRSLELGEPAIVRVKFNVSLSDIDGSVHLQSSDGLRIETPPLQIPGEREVNWRIRAINAGTHMLVIQIGNRSIEKRIQVESGLVQLSPRRVSSRFRSFFYPSEPMLANETAIKFIEVSYPEMRLQLAGYNLHWMIPFTMISMVFAFALRRPFKVVI